MRLRIATMNLWGLPAPLSVHKPQRMRDAAEIILSRRLDIVALQEVWMLRDIAFLKKRLAGYHVFVVPNIFFNTSGMMLFSRFPLTAALYHPFKRSFFNKEIPSRKGYYRAIVQIQGIGITLFNTHLYYSSGDNESTVHASQLRELTAALDHRPTILMGDFNATHGSLHFPVGYQLLSNPNALTVLRDNPYANKRFNSINSSDRSPDLLYANFPHRLIDAHAIPSPFVSDHSPVVAEIEL